MSSRKIYRKLGAFNMPMYAYRNYAVAESLIKNGQPCKNWSMPFNKLKAINNLNKHTKKSDYHTAFLKRDMESDRMKNVKQYEKRKLRNLLKKETKQIIDEDLQ